MKTLVIWLLGTVYVLAALAGMAVVVWAADHGDNSTDPTHWGIGSALVLAPLATLGVLRLVGPWIRERVGHGRGTILLGAGLAAGAGLALVVGARAIIADASACSDDDCVTIAVPVGVLCVLGAWSLPLGLSALRRLRYPAPLMSVGLVAAMTTLVAGSAAAVQSSGQEDNYADLTPGVVVSAWILPASLAVVAMVVVRGPTGRATHRTAGHRTAAGYLVSVGGWFMALPLVAGVDSDSLPILLAMSGGPGLILLTVGLAALVPGSRPS